MIPIYKFKTWKRNFAYIYNQLKTFVLFKKYFISQWEQNKLLLLHIMFPSFGLLHEFSSVSVVEWIMQFGFSVCVFRNWQKFDWFFFWIKTIKWTKTASVESNSPLKSTYLSRKIVGSEIQKKPAKKFTKNFNCLIFSSSLEKLFPTVLVYIRSVTDVKSDSLLAQKIAGKIQKI